MVYAAEEPGGGTRLYLRSLFGQESVGLAGTEGAYLPFFSPDARWVGFVSGGQLSKVSLDDGSVVTLAQISDPAGAVWTEEHEILVSQNAGLVRFSAATGERQDTAARCADIHRGCWLPQPLPGGEWVLVSSYRDMAVVSLETGERRTLFDSLHTPMARWLPSGHIAYFHRPGQLFAVPFDHERLEITGSAVPVLDGIRQAGMGGQYAISSTGHLAYIDGGSGIRGQLTWVTRGGQETALPFDAESFGVFNLSPDGRYVVAVIYRTNSQLWVFDLERGTSRPLVTDGFSEQPVWSPDGAEIAFVAVGGAEDRNFPIMVVPAGGGASPEVLIEDGGYPTSWSETGRLAIERVNQGETINDVWVASLEEGTLEVIRRSPAVDAAPYFSPDGQSLAYFSGATGQWEVYVEPYPPTGDAWPVSAGGGAFPRWSPDGQELYYVRGREFFAVDLSQGPQSVRAADFLFEGPYVTTYGHAFDVAPDGQRFLVVKGSDPRTSSRSIGWVENWLMEVEAAFR